MSLYNPDDWKVVDCPMGNPDCVHVLHSSSFDPSGWVEVASFPRDEDLETNLAELMLQFQSMLAAASLHREKVEGAVMAKALRDFADRLQRDFNLDDTMTVRQVVQRLAGAAIYHEAVKPALNN